MGTLDRAVDRSHNSEVRIKNSKLNIQNCPVGVFGVPWDEKSSYLRGCADAPTKIWEAFNSYSTNRSAENGYDLGKDENFTFQGNMELSSGDEVVDEIAKQSSEIIEKGITPLFLGGDHAVTYPLVKGLAEHHKKINILHFDAHPDLYDNLEGDKYSHACPFARLWEEGLITRHVAVGIRTMNRHQKEQAEKFGSEIIDMMSFDPNMVIEFDGPVYISLDLDVLDPAFAPGISHYEPGGMTTRELIRIIQNFKGNLIGADIVEYNHTRDVNGVTAMVAAKLMKEVAVRLLED